MALFKYSGTTPELDGKAVRDGFVHATVDYKDESNPGLGFQDVAQWWLDIGEKRYRVAAASLIDETGKLIEIDDITLKDDIIDLEHGGTDTTGDTARDAAAAAGARTNLNVYSKTESDNNYYAKSNTYTKAETDSAIDVAISKATTLKINPEDILEDTATQNETEKYYYIYSNTDLRCGKDQNVPPLITATENREEYSLIDHAIATAGVGITFYFEDKPEKAIDLIIVDNA